MWIYEKKLQYPVRVSKCDPRMARYLVEQYGGADGELSAALRYLNQRYTIPDKVIGLLTDIGTEEFAHLEMIATMIYKLTKDATPEQLEAAGLGPHFVNHDSALFYNNAAGNPWTATYIQAKGDPIIYQGISKLLLNLIFLAGTLYKLSILVAVDILRLSAFLSYLYNDPTDTFK